MEYKRQFMEWERQMARQFADGKKEGLQEKAVNDAVLLVKKYKATPESAASDMEAPLELVLERLKGQFKRREFTSRLLMILQFYLQKTLPSIHKAFRGRCF